MDPITIGLLAGGGMGLLNGNANVKKQAEQDKYRKVAIAMSPWTGMGDPGSLNLPGPLASAASGAAMGGQVGGMFKGAPAAPAAGVSSQAAPPMPGAAPGGNMLGGADMSQQLGAQYGMPDQQAMGSPGSFGGNFKYNLMAQR